MKKLLLSLITLSLLPSAMSAQRLQQPTGRGVVAVNRSGSSIRSVTSSGGTGSLISWRKLAEEPEGTTYNVYKRGAGTTGYTKVNTKPLSVTCLSTTLTNNTEYAVAAVGPDGVEGQMSVPFLYKTRAYPNVWFDFNFDNSVIRRDDYRTKYAWPMDTDGDGEFDAVVVDRLFAGATGGDDAEEATDNTATTTHKIQGYRLDGTLLWTVDMGPNVNICAGQNDMVVAYDIDCDGLCEVIIRSSDGTRFWDKAAGTWGRYACGSADADTDGDGIIDYRSQTKRNPPFYVSVVDGLTGEEKYWAEADYGSLTDGADRYSRDNRSAYMNFGYGAMEGHYGIAYLDGIHPSLVMECADRESGGLHHVYVLAWGFDWPQQSSHPSNWHHSHTWSANDKRPLCAEFHQIRILDGDGDGCDELWTGSYGVNPAQDRFVSTGLAHGDRFIISDIDPDRPGLEGYSIQQSALLGQALYDTRTAERIKEWYLPSVYDVGRGACLDMDAKFKGYEILSYADEFVYTCKGEKTGQTRSGTMFEGVWWDGRLQREWLNSPGGSGVGTNLMVTRVLGDRLCEFSQESAWATHANTGTRPAFMGDIIGDWREEVVLAKQDANSSTGLVGYTTNMPTTYSIYCLQQDPHYRLDCTTRGYYQHPNTGYYLGGDMPMPPLPPVYQADLRNSIATGKSSLFDLTAPGSVDCGPGAVSPTALYLMNPRGHDITFTVSTAGTGQLIKSMQGTATFSGTLGHTGQNIVSEGTLRVNGTIGGPVELRARGTLSGNAVLSDTITFEGALNYEGCRLMPGNGGDDAEGVISSKKSMALPGNVYLEVTAGLVGNAQGTWPACGSLSVDGDLTFRNTNCITVNLLVKEAAEYVLARCTGTLTCDPSKLTTRGLEGINYDLAVRDNKLLLIINSTREAQGGVTWTGAESNAWDYKALNFSVPDVAAASQQPVPSAFVAGDSIVFTADGQKKSITVSEMMVTGGVTFRSGKYTLGGDGGISGEGGVTVERDADVTLNMSYSDYTGATIVNGGTLTVPNFYDGGQKSAIGAAAATKGNLQLNGGTLVLAKDNMATDRQLTLTDTATIRVAQSSSALSLKGQASGTGYLIKDGPGRLNFNYGGANTFAGIIVKRGSIAQGAWNASFCKVGGPMLLAGGEVHLIDNNTSSTQPVFNYVTTVQEGTSNTIVGTSRGKINGSFRGSGNLTIRTKYVRCDVGASFAGFEGQLTAIGEGGNFRLMTSAADMSKARLVVGTATTLSFMKGGGGNEDTGTLKVGALSGTATDGVLGGSSSSYTVGYLNTDTSFKGLAKCARLTKVGTGKLTLSTAGHTAPMTVSGGTLELSNSSAATFTAGLITVANGGTLQGNALATSVTVNNGGTLTAGVNGNTGTLRLAAALRLNEGSTLLIKLGRVSGNDKLTVKGLIAHNGDTLLIRVPEGRTLKIGDELTIFNTGFSSATGTPVVKVEGGAYAFDLSTLNTDGKIRAIDIADVNRDGSVDVADISSVVSVMAGGSGTGTEQTRTADVNNDGAVDVADISAVISRMAEMARLLRGIAY